MPVQTLKLKTNIMKKFITIALALASASATFAEVWVNGHFHSHGTYVQQHFRSSPNSTVFDNWSYKGNANPFTGKIGTRTYGW